MWTYWEAWKTQMSKIKALETMSDYDWYNTSVHREVLGFVPFSKVA